MREHATDLAAKGFEWLGLSERGAQGMGRKVVDPAAMIAPGFSTVVEVDEAQSLGDYAMAAAGIFPPVKAVKKIAKAVKKAPRPKYRPGEVARVGGRKFVTSSDGTIDFGFMDKFAMQSNGQILPKKPIRAELGIPGKDGFGAQHLDPARHERARKLGYKDAVDMFEDVSRNHDIIVEQADGRLMLVKENGANRYAVVELQQGADAYYGLTTSFPEQSGNVGKPNRTSLSREINKRGGKVIWRRQK